jgi:hypothetical protein
MKEKTRDRVKGNGGRASAGRPMCDYRHARSKYDDDDGEVPGVREEPCNISCGRKRWRVSRVWMSWDGVRRSVPGKSLAP